MRCSTDFDSSMRPKLDGLDRGEGALYVLKQKLTAESVDLP
jgi:hypothetical protein